MDLRSSPSQQHLHPSRSSSLDSHDGTRGGGNEIDPPTATTLESRSHKLDLYSIPVFLLELLVLAGLAFAAYYVHFEYRHEPFISGFYCDDTSYRQQFDEDKLTEQFIEQESEIAVLSLMLAIPIVIIIFCELVNSMFGSLKFRQIRALCTCCKLHSITRRTIRFSGAYLLGFLIVLISCDILANTTGRLRPYFAQECTNAYQQCVRASQPTRDSYSNSRLPTGAPPSPPQPSVAPIEFSSPTTMLMSNASSDPPVGVVETLVEPVVALNRSTRSTAMALARQAPNVIAERYWVDLTDKNLTQLCNFARDGEQISWRARTIAMSWPSSPAATFTFACLFLACYLCFVGTARPFRIISSVLVMCLLLLATIFNVQLVKVHFHHWDDVAAGAALAFVVTVFVLMVYLNKFKDTHYYENQKLYKRKIYVYENFRGRQNESGSFGNYNPDKNEQAPISLANLQNGDTSNSLSNDLAMRYFQIPRANYRGGQRPLSSLNQMH